MKSRPDIEPETHDGSYQLVREAIKSYSKLESRKKVDYNDIDLIYTLSTIKAEKSRYKDYVKKSNLSDDEKKRLEDVIDSVWNKAKNGMYKNVAKSPISVGMFESSFSTYNKSGNNKDLPKKIIEALLFASNHTDEETYQYLIDNLNENIKGIASDSFSIMGHCVRPDVFPIMNYNEGDGNVYGLLGLELPKQKKIADYATACKIIKKYRDENFYFKNYRVMDKVARMMLRNVNYKMIFDFMDRYAGHIYASEKNCNVYLKNKKITESEVRTIKDIRKKGDEVKENLEILSKCFAKEYKNMTDCKLKQEGENRFYKQNNNSKTKSEVRDYLWYKLVENNYEKIPCSLSIFIEKDVNNIQRVRACIEWDSKAEINYKNIKDKNDDYMLEEQISKAKIKYDEFKLNTLPEGLEFVAGSNEKNNIRAVNGDASEIKDKIQISKVISKDDSKTNDQYTEELINGFKQLIPYYEYVIGKSSTVPKVQTVQKNDFTSQEEENVMKQSIGLNTILYGPPGTGKTYSTKIYAVSICMNASLEEVSRIGYDEVTRKYNMFVKEGRIVFTTFHQSYGYEEFIEGIQPIIQNENINEEDGKKNLYYDILSGVFKKFCEKVSADSEGKPCVFIIDEINRGNISKIFGELITLIEPSKRKGKKEEMSAILPYSREPFGVPNNVYILGTMNTADRSISLMDTALRRRFDFVEIMPDLKVINGKNVAGVDIAKMLDAINKRIIALYDREHTIGHAFFTELNSNSTINDLAVIFKNKILPLLQEYFYEDYSKIRLVLGDNGTDNAKEQFIIEELNDVSKIFKGGVSQDEIPVNNYEINEEAFFNVDSYKKIY